MKRLLIGLAAFGCVLSLSRASRAAEVCIDERAKAALDACAGVTAREVHNTPGASRAPHGKLEATPAKRDATPPQPPPISDPRDDERIGRIKVRQKGLLVTEIQGLESLFSNTSRTSPDRVTLARRLAEDYAELESVGFREKTQAEAERDRLRRQNDPAMGKKQTEANVAAGVEKGARAKAIQYYALIKNEHPSYAALDEVLYFLAYEHEQDHDAKSARAVYYELLQKAPQSKYVPHAYLAFGELFFAEAQGDPQKWSLAEKAYAEVVKYPAPNNKVWGYAFYKLAYVHWNTGDLARALHAFKKVVDFGVAYPALPGATRLAESARRDLVPVYALKGDPARAYAFFKTVAAPGPGDESTFKMMDDLGNSYLDTGHYPEGILLYRDLAARNRTGAQPCLYQARITQATMAMKGGAKDATVAELDLQLKALRDARASGASAADKQRCENASAEVVVETAMSWHFEATGTADQRGTNDAKTMAAAAQLYKKIIDSWSSAELAKVEYARLVREDWPRMAQIKYARADLLYAQEKWAECGPAFDEALAEDPKAADAAEAAHAAVLCYQKTYDKEHAAGAARRGIGQMPGSVRQEVGDELFAAKPMTEHQTAMIGAFNRYICHVKPAAGDKEGQSRLVEIKYARARTYFEARRWDEAAVGFRDVAVDHAGHDAAVYAAQLYLESVNVLRDHAKPRRTGCVADMKRDVPKFLDSFCGGDRGRGSSDCASLTRVQVDLLRLEAEEDTARAAAATGAAALALHERAGGAYFEMFRRYCQEPAAAGRAPEADRCDEIAYNAAKSFQAARLVAKAITARKALVDYDAKAKGSSPWAKKAVYEIGGSYQAIAVYDVAAEWYERFAKQDPKAEKADVALADAVLLRLGLGQEAEALEDARLFSRSYGAAKPVQTAAVAYAVGAHYAEKEEWEKARGALAGSMSIIDRAAPDVQVQAHATYARALARLRRDGEARAEYAKVQSLWRDPAAAEAKIRAAYAGEDEAQKDKRLGRALGAVGEAYFMAAEDARRARVDSLRFPDYRGPGTKADVLRHVGTKVKDWYEKKKAAIQEVEPEYVKILEIKPVAPPRWVIAAGSRSGLMWGDFVDDFRRAPIPAEWKSDDELRNTYTTELYRVSEPYKANLARPALEKCLKLSLQHQYFDEQSRSCEVWLAKNYKAEYHVVDELRGAPSLVNSGLAERAPPLARLTRP
ncbi:MAG: hypothetical protein JNL38_27725 [Myxococcales bacterium]|nr:hypothetical protein [Myxococcales bacterium]